ncbi:MAG: hypothetical protein RL094_24 [Candidatus Parcubacteria bacterium]|jgi:hypothetical protein
MNTHSIRQPGSILELGGLSKDGFRFIQTTVEGAPCILSVRKFFAASQLLVRSNYWRFLKACLAMTSLPGNIKTQIQQREEADLSQMTLHELCALSQKVLPAKMYASDKTVGFDIGARDRVLCRFMQRLYGIQGAPFWQVFAVDMMDNFLFRLRDLLKEHHQDLGLGKEDFVYLQRYCSFLQQLGDGLLYLWEAIPPEAQAVEKGETRLRLQFMEVIHASLKGVKE